MTTVPRTPWGPARPAAPLARRGASSPPCPPWSATGATRVPQRCPQRGVAASHPTCRGLRPGSRSSLRGRPVCCSTSAHRGLDRCPRPPRSSGRGRPDLHEPGGRHPRSESATETVPIVFTLVGDPVGAGIVGKLVQPGGNVTGVIESQTAGGKAFGGPQDTRSGRPPSLGHLLQNRHGHHADDHQGARGGAAHEAGALA